MKYIKQKSLRNGIKMIYKGHSRDSVSAAGAMTALRDETNQEEAMTFRITRQWYLILYAAIVAQGPPYKAVVIWRKAFGPSLLIVVISAHSTMAKLTLRRRYKRKLQRVV